MNKYLYYRILFDMLYPNNRRILTTDHWQHLDNKATKEQKEEAMKIYDSIK